MPRKDPTQTGPTPQATQPLLPAVLRFRPRPPGAEGRERSPEKKNLRGVVDPEEEHHESARRTVAGTQADPAEIDSKGELPDPEQKRRKEGPPPQVTMLYFRASQYLKKKGYE